MIVDELASAIELTGVAPVVHQSPLEFDRQNCRIGQGEGINIDHLFSIRGAGPKSEVRSPRSECFDDEVPYMDRSVIFGLRTTDYGPRQRM